MGTELRHTSIAFQIGEQQPLPSSESEEQSSYNTTNPNSFPNLKATEKEEDMKRSASASFESMNIMEQVQERGTQSVQKKKSSREAKEEYSNPIGLETDPKEPLLSTEPLGPLPVNSSTQSIPTEKELIAAKEARIRLGLEQPDVNVPISHTEPQMQQVPSGTEPSKAIEAEYIQTEDLKPLDDVNAVLKTVFDELKTTDWQQMCIALNKVRSLAVFNPEACSHILTELIVSVLKLLKNPRSLVCKTAVMCLTDLVRGLKNDILPFLDIGGPQKPANSVLCQLFLKACTDKHFVVEEVQKTLKTMGEVLETSKMIDILVPYTEHRNPNVRGKAGSILILVVNRIPKEDFSVNLLSGILKVAANLVTDKMPDARESAKQTIHKLQSVFQFQCSCNQTTQADAVVNVNMEDGKANEEKNGSDKDKDDDDDDDSYLSYSDDEELKEKEKPVSEWKKFCEEHLTTTQILAVMKICHE